MPVMQVYLKSNEPLSDLLERSKLEYVENSRPPKYKIIKEYLNKLEIVNDDDSIKNSRIESDSPNDSFFVKCFILYSVPAALPYAWINHIFSICFEVQMWIRPIPHDESITRMTRFKDLIYEDSKNNNLKYSQMYVKLKIIRAIAIKFHEINICLFSSKPN